MIDRNIRGQLVIQFLIIYHRFKKNYVYQLIFEVGEQHIAGKDQCENRRVVELNYHD